MPYNSTLKAALQAAITTPANPKISGTILQQQLLAMVNAMEAGAVFMGAATPATSPTGEANCFYLATTQGTYTNFLDASGNAITLSAGEVAFLSTVYQGNNLRYVKNSMPQPHIDPTTGDWFVGSVDTGVKAQGKDGDPGTPGTNAYVHIMYAASQPTHDSDMHNTPLTGDKWIGVYSGNLEEAPTAYTSYVWSKYVGKDGTGIGSFKYESYDADAAADLVDVGDTTTEDIGELSASQSTLDVIVLMPNAASSPTKTMMIATQEASTPNTYEFVYIGDLQNAIPNDIFSNQAKLALISLLSKVAYIDDNGQTYIDTLQNLLLQGATIESITATLKQDAVIVDTMTAEDTKPYITVVANMSDNTTMQVDSFSVTGTLSTAGSVNLTISALGETTTLTVAVLHNYSDVVTNFGFVGSISDTGIAKVENGRIKLRASSTAYSIWTADVKGKTRWGEVVGKTLMTRIKISGTLANGEFSLGAHIVNTESLGNNKSIRRILATSSAVLGTDGYYTFTNRIMDLSQGSWFGSYSPDSNSAFGVVIYPLSTTDYLYIEDVQIIDVTPANS